MSELEDRIVRLPVEHRRLLELMLAEGEPRIAPRTPVETTLVQVWQEVLEVEAVGITDDYVELGGDSILAIVIVARALEAGVEINAQDLFDARTIEALAPLTRPSALDPVAARPEVAVGTALPLTPLQEGMLYHALEGRTPGAYLVQLACVLDGVLDVAAFRSAWQAVLATHPALRAHFRWAGVEEPTQRVAATVDLDLTVVDQRALDADEQEAAWQDHLRSDRRLGMDLRCAPLMRLVLFRDADDRHRFLWTHHHLVLDGWSQQLVLRDLVDHYREARGGHEPPVHAGWPEYLQRIGARDPGTSDEFWRDRLAGARPMPGTGMAVHGQGERMKITDVWPGELWTALQAFSRGTGVTVGTALCAGWGLVLGCVTDRDDVVFGCTVSGRPDDLAGITGTVGLFINTLPVRIRSAPEERVSDWLVRVQDDQAAARRHELSSLRRITRVCGFGTGPLFDTILVVENFPSWLGEGGDAGGLTVREIDVTADEGYPLVIEVVPGAELVVRARHDPARVPPATVRRMLELLHEFARALPVEPTVAELRDRLAEHDGRATAAEQSRQRAAATARLRAARRKPADDPEPQVGP